jgi:hypothetical protein
MVLVEKYNALKWRIKGFRKPKIDEYILCYDQNWQKIINKVDSEINKRCFIMERISDVK